MDTFFFYLLFLKSLSVLLFINNNDIRYVEYDFKMFFENTLCNAYF